MLPRPWVKWAYEPARAEDIPAVFMRAVATALQPAIGSRVSLVSSRRLGGAL